ncbi:FecR family protein [Lewinella sp. LCG006]|uniref:FecR family protein n=1 Tax=Lewinella sp. LCG006 TaxID=3231911 RepID=UPI00345FF0F6
MRSWEQLRKSRGQSADESAQGWEQLWKGSEKLGDDFEPNVEAGLARLKQRMAQEDMPSGRVVKMNTSTRWLRAVAAAVVLALVTWGTMTFIGGDTAPDFAWAELHTTEGETREVVLPDGSTVTMNSNTHLRYRSDLDIAEVRDIRLEGEAFFDVNRRPEQPFIIRTANVEVSVLGTSFNVRDIPGSARTEVEVASGKVGVKSLVDVTQQVVLKAEEAVVLENNVLTTYTTADRVFNGVNWRKGQLSFKNTPLEEALPQIERAYQVDLVWKTTALRNCEITGNWQEENFAAVVEILEGLTGLNVNKVAGNKYELSGSCD